MSRDDDGFLARWSRTKRAAAEGAGQSAGSPPAEASVSAPPPDPDERAEAQSDDEILQALGLKHPDLLGPGDDFGAFLRDAVPEHLRRLALRRLWRTNPVLANLDGLNDYDTDFTGGTVAPGALRTAYQVGAGLVHAAVEAGIPAPVSGNEAGPEAETSAQDDTVHDSAKDSDCSAPLGEFGMERQIVQDYDARPVRQRMRFRFET